MLLYSSQLPLLFCKKNTSLTLFQLVRLATLLKIYPFALNIFFLAAKPFFAIFASSSVIFSAGYPFT
ncbi:MAG: hypothetical protein EAZ55_14600 [Cytophagales bacterium]|nr:MAG: hypothetical protein EAZ55_14600 [Cytophagales bacterium]